MNQKDFKITFDVITEYYFSDRKSQALEELLELEQAQDLTEDQLFVVLEKIGKCYLSLHQPAEALTYLDRALLLKKDDQSVKQHLLSDKARALAESHRYLEALACYREAVLLQDSHDELDYLAPDIDETIRDFHNYLQHGTVEQRRQKMVEQLDQEMYNIKAEMIEEDLEGPVT